MIPWDISVVRELNGRPEIEGMPANLTSYYSLENSIGRYAVAGVNWGPIVAQLHLHVDRWGPRTVLEIKKDLEYMKEQCKLRGICRIQAVTDRFDNGQWKKFAKMFGFTHYYKLQIAEMEVS
jgi:hypothetical protein